MQPTHQDHRTERNTTPLVNKLDREANRGRETETLEQPHSVRKQMRERKGGREEGGLKNRMPLPSKEKLGIEKRMKTQR